jgi:glycosyltransferase involved in cell wall biosynthesis
LLAKKTVVFFDLITHYGGAQAGTVLLAQRLQRYYNVHVIDGYGTSEPFCRRLREAGLRTHIVQPQSSPKYFGYYDKPLIRLLRILRQAPSLWRLARDLGRLLGELGADLVWVNGAKALAVLVLSGATRHVPVVYYARGWYRREQYPSHHRWLIRRFAYDVLAVSTATRAALEEWGLPATRIHVVYNQVDFDEVLASAAMPSPSLPGLDQHPRILVPAHLMREKGQHTAVCAVGLWKRQGATFSLWLAGAKSTSGTWFASTAYSSKSTSSAGAETCPPSWPRPTSCSCPRIPRVCRGPSKRPCCSASR